MTIKFLFCFGTKPQLLRLETTVYLLFDVRIPAVNRLVVCEFHEYEIYDIYNYHYIITL